MGHQDNADLRAYYARRAREYETIYYRDDPVRQAEQEALGTAMREALAGRRVLEIACGTGYWTARLVGAVRSIVAVDAAREVLEIARSKALPAGTVTFRHGDAYALNDVPGEFDGALAAFWFSHVPHARVNAFLAGLKGRLEAGAIVFLADNCLVSGVGGDLVTKPGCADTFKRRALADGSTHEVLKNYYDADQLRAILRPSTRDLTVHVGRCFWWARYAVA